MRPNIDFVECLKDSPKFRASLEDAETDITVLEGKLEKLVKLCNGMIEAGKTYNNANSAFINGVKDVALHFHDDDLVSDDNTVSEAMRKFTHVLSEQQKYHNILLDQAQRSIHKNLTSFIKNDIRKVKETQKHFEKISDDMDNALTKNAQSLKSKPHECEESRNILTAMRSCFGHTSLDYVFQLNVLHSKKRFDVLDTMLAYMHAQSTFYHQGYDLFDDIDPYLKQVAAQLDSMKARSSYDRVTMETRSKTLLDELSSKAAAERKEMEDRHSLVQQKELSLSAPHQLPPNSTESIDDVKKEGYLFKRTSNAFKTWVRRWFMIQDNQLVYRKRSKDTLTIMEDDLRLCTVKPAYEIDRQYCFEVVSPSRSHIMQADSESECQSWITAIQKGVSTAYNNRNMSIDCSRYEEAGDMSGIGSDNKSTASSESSGGSSQGTTADAQASSSGATAKVPAKKTWKPKSTLRMEAILAIHGNNKCCDCGSPDPRWSSINLGITLCIECSGIHRSFGVHMSKVRSLTLDAWEPELYKVMTELGNERVNRIYESNVDESIAPRATPHCDRTTREAWVRAKYVQKAFVRRLPENVEQDEQAAAPSNSLSPKRWSVFKRKRRSPPKSNPQEAIPEGNEEGIKQGESQDSGLGGSAADVIIFGAAVDPDSSQAAIDLDLDDSGSASEPEADQDTRSTTSFEDFSKLSPDLLLYKASQARNIPVMLEALALGASPNWHNDDEDRKTPLIKAVESSSMAAVEFMLLNGGKVDFKDDNGRTPLHHATILGHTGQVCQFLKRSANQHAVDGEGLDPLSIAINNANADIVTLLRLAKLNEEMRETEGIYGAGGDETFNEVFRDFTNMANNAPEKLTRNK